MPLWRCSVLYQVKNVRAKARAASIDPKRAGKPGRYLRVLKWASELGVVVRDVRPRMALGDAEVGQQEGDRLGRHRAAAIGMDRERAGRDGFAWPACRR